jgi:lipopolysaccharide/colanic/teichoic acid biosynthesis glycosyltransferase
VVDNVGVGEYSTIIGRIGLPILDAVTCGGRDTTQSDELTGGLRKGGRMSIERVPWPTEMSVAPVLPIPRPTVSKHDTLYVRAVKPGFDVCAAAIALVVAALPMIVIAGVVALTMGRPVLFRQCRIGLDGEPFEVLKFRTMRPDRRSQRLDVIHDRRRTHKSPADPRHTSVGRFLRRHSLDELPQLFNVLRGEMSMVGPRPELESVVATYPAPLHQRHQVKPGLTGPWQVWGRGSGPMHENGQWDLAYVEQVSLRTDVRILVRTPAVLIGGQSGS